MKSTVLEVVITIRDLIIDVRGWLIQIYANMTIAHLYLSCICSSKLARAIDQLIYSLHDQSVACTNSKIQWYINICHVPWDVPVLKLDKYVYAYSVYSLSTIHKHFRFWVKKEATDFPFFFSRSIDRFKT